jgi:Ca2+-transporting ATPase
VGAKGAPEVVISLCGLENSRRDTVLKQIHVMAAEGLRVLAVAKTETPEPLLPEHQNQFQFQFVGLIGLKDPARPGVQDFIKECMGAGIRVIMMTGDHPGTALSIAKDLGIPTDAGVMTGREMDALSDLYFSIMIGLISVFSRLTPSHKLRMVKLLQARGEHVAMTGDGVNDAEALKCANIGIAMGERGTDVAREAADLVLQHDDFGSILAAIKAGRGVRENLREAFQYLFSVHVPLVGLSILPALFRLPQVLLPIHIALLHLVIEPVCSLAFESEPKSVGILKLEKAQIPIFDRSTLKNATWVGLKVFLALVLVYFFAWYRGKGEWDTRGLTFSALLFANSALLIRQAKRSETRKRLWLGLGGGSLLLFFFGVQFRPILELLKVNPIHPLDWILTAILGVLGGWWGP